MSFAQFPAAPSPLADVIAAAAGGDVTLVDVREPSEIAASGRAAGAISIPLGTLLAKANPQAPGCDPRLSPSRPVAVYCAAGARAGRARDLLLQLGYRDVTNLGGLADWQRAGGPVTR